MKLSDIVQQVGGKIAGDAALEITGAMGLEFAGPSDITYIAERKYLPRLPESRAAALFVSEKIETDKAQIIHPQPAVAFARLLALLHPASRPRPGVHPSAVMGEHVTLGKEVTLCPHVTVGDRVKIGEGTVLHPGVVVGDDCTIGRDTVLFPKVVLYPETVIGNHVRVHAGAVIGADGFSYTPDEQGHHVKMQQIGRVVIEDHVEIGANTCIDRAAFGETVICEGVKIDNLVQIAHNCRIGDHSILVSQVGLSGSCQVGQHNTLAGQVGLADHVTLGDKVTLMARAGVFRDLPEAGLYGWAPAMPMSELMHFMPVLLRLPNLAAQVKEIERRLHAIEKA